MKPLMMSIIKAYLVQPDSTKDANPRTNVTHRWRSADFALQMITSTAASLAIKLRNNLHWQRQG